MRRTQIVTGERPRAAVKRPVSAQQQWTWNDQRAEVVDHSTGARYPMAAFRRGRFGLRQFGAVTTLDDRRTSTFAVLLI